MAPDSFLDLVLALLFIHGSSSGLGSRLEAGVVTKLGPRLGLRLVLGLGGGLGLLLGVGALPGSVARIWSWTLISTPRWSSAIGILPDLALDLVLDLFPDLASYLGIGLSPGPTPTFGLARDSPVHLEHDLRQDLVMDILPCGALLVIGHWYPPGPVRLFGLQLVRRPGPRFVPRPGTKFGPRIGIRLGY